MPASIAQAPPTISTNASTSTNNPLDMPSKRWQQGLPESRLLWADEAVVPFTGQTELLQTLNTWLDDSQHPLAIRLITGAGGTGKTRLGLELCSQRLQQNWLCGFWRSQENSNVQTLWQALVSYNQPALLVIDYAETRQDELLGLIKASQKAPHRSKVRVLLLARTGGEWWDRLPGKDRDCELLLSSYATSGPYTLPLLHLESEHRSLAYQDAIAIYAQYLQIAPPRFIPDLSDEHFAKPLYLQMAALLALLDLYPSSAESLTKALLNHERRYWQKALSTIDLVMPDTIAEHLLGLATLAGGFTTAKMAWNYWQNMADMVIDASKFNLVFKALTPLYPGKPGLPPKQPDLLGEALVAQLLSQTDGQKLLTTVLSQPDLQYNGLTVLARLANHRAALHQVLEAGLLENFVRCCQKIIKVAVETPGELTKLACVAFTQLPIQQKSQASGFLAPLFQNESVELARLDFEVSAYEASKSASKLNKKAKRASDSEYSEHASNLHKLSIAAHRIGGKDELALKMAKQSLDIRHSLAVKNSERFEPKYAFALVHYATCMSDLGHSEKAFASAKQALDIYQRLATKNPDRFEPDFAMALHNYANLQGDLRQAEDALVSAKQALDIYQRLATKNPDRFEPDYAMALHNHANYWSDLGYSEDALTSAKQALDIYQRLATKNPDRFEPDYANILNTYASCLNVLGYADKALEPTEQSLNIYQRLATKNPDRFEPDYANILNTYASCLNVLGYADKALEPAEQSLNIYQRVVKKNTGRFESYYVTALNNYANHLSDLGQAEKALAPSKQALDIYQRLAAKSPLRYEEGYFLTLCNLLFLQWLAQQAITDSVPKTIPLTIAEHRKSALTFYLAVIQGCLTTESSIRQACFKSAYQCWQILPQDQQTNAMPDYLCIYAWLRQYHVESISEVDFHDAWQTFLQKRQQHTPVWMVTASQRLGFIWPEQGQDSTLSSAS